MNRKGWPTSWLVGQRCANAVLDRRPEIALDELTACYELLGRIDSVRVSECTYATLAGYRDTLGEYFTERTDV